MDGKLVMEIRRVDLVQSLRNRVAKVNRILKVMKDDTQRLKVVTEAILTRESAAGTVAGVLASKKRTTTAEEGSSSDETDSEPPPKKVAREEEVVVETETREQPAASSSPVVENSAAVGEASATPHTVVETSSEAKATIPPPPTATEPLAETATEAKDTETSASQASEQGTPIARGVSSAARVADSTAPVTPRRIPATAFENLVGDAKKRFLANVPCIQRRRDLWEFNPSIPRDPATLQWFIDNTADKCLPPEEEVFGYGRTWADVEREAAEEAAFAAQGKRPPWG